MLLVEKKNEALRRPLREISRADKVLVARMKQATCFPDRGSFAEHGCLSDHRHRMSANILQV
jgi:hypothetical protein